MDIWSKLNYNWKYIEEDEIKKGDVCIVIHPIALYGRRHDQFDWLIEKCDKVGALLILDEINLPTSITYGGI